MISYICSIVAQDEGAAIVVVAACMTLGTSRLYDSNYYKPDSLRDVYQDRLYSKMGNYNRDFSGDADFRNSFNFCMDTIFRQFILQFRSNLIRNLHSNGYSIDNRRKNLQTINGRLCCGSFNFIY